jgi:L-lysine 2,3-aminomutase
VIEDEIREGSRQKIEKLKGQIEENNQELAAVKEQVSALNIEVTDRYAGRLGKENLQSDVLEQIAKQIRNGSAATITDAVNAVRNNKL